MSSVAVLALGNWGTALANHLAVKGHEVIGWSREQAIVDGIKAHGKNPVYQKQVTLHPGLKVSTDLACASQCDFIVVACPSSALSEVIPKLVLKPNSIVVSAVKGFVGTTLLTPLQYARTVFPKNIGLSVLSGPSFARDVVVQNPAGVVAASSDLEIAKKVAELFSSERMKVYLAHDVIGVEVGGIVKNVIALAAGISDGMNLGESAKAGLITRGLAEMMRLATALGGDSKTLAGLSGLGDLAMTATCDTSRNRTVGLRLGAGETLEQIITTLGSVAEGVRSAPLVTALAKKHNVEMPICFEVDRFLRGEVALGSVVKNLVTRPMRKEFE